MGKGLLIDTLDLGDVIYLSSAERLVLSSHRSSHVMRHFLVDLQLPIVEPFFRR